MSARQGRRSRHITARLSRNPELRKQVGGHQSVLVEREAILNRERSLLRQVGDAIAWLVLRTDPAIIGPLWAPGRTHYLPTGIGLDAPVQIIRDLNASGEFFAVFNDLTRCLGVGDITVVPANTPWPVPLSMELKAKQVDDVGSQAEIDFLSPHSDEPEFAALFQSVRVCLGLKDRGQPTTDSRAQRQIDELLERTDLLFRMRGRLATRLPPPGSNHWGSIRQLLNNSYTNGSAFDFPEAGVAYFSVRLHDNEGAAPQLQRVLDRVKVHQPPETVAMAVSTADLAESRSSVHPRPPNTPLAHSRRPAECPSCGPIVPGGDHHRGRVE